MSVIGVICPASLTAGLSNRPLRHRCERSLRYLPVHPGLGVFTLIRQPNALFCCVPQREPYERGFRLKRQPSCFSACTIRFVIVSSIRTRLSGICTEQTLFSKGLSPAITQIKRSLSGKRDKLYRTRQTANTEKKKSSTKKPEADASARSEKTDILITPARKKTLCQFFSKANVLC